MKMTLFAAWAAGLAWASAGAVQAAPGDLLVTLYADHDVAYLDPSTGEAHAFMCLTRVDAKPEPGAAPAGPECFGFYPRGAAVTLIRLSDGGLLTKYEEGWRETPGGHFYQQIPGPSDNVVLRDAGRDVTWTLSIPQGGSRVTRAGRSTSGANVESVAFAAEPAAFIGADQPAGDFQERPKPWSEAGLKYAKVIDAARRTDLLSIIRNWNTRAIRLTPAATTELLDAVAATIGARRPAPSADQSPAGYVQALIAANRRKGVHYEDSTAKTPATNASRSPPSNK